MSYGLTEQETSKTPWNTMHEKSAGTRISPGPYIGQVKSVIDPFYSGAIQVYIEELGGDPNDPTSWKKMMYATPFYGRTNIQDGAGDKGSPNSYGMWFVPPDIDNKVLCIFAEGRPDLGFWFACIPDWPALHMIPGISAPVDGSGVAPVVDYYADKDNSDGLANVRTLSKYPHSFQQQIWDKQGLTQDPDRGPGSSSAQRETPSAVFGISTPGRPADPNDPSLYPASATTSGGVASSGVDGQISGVRGRRGGHTFVMDDGDSDGNNQMFRLRSAAGHMILMNDTKEFIYIINSAGTSFVEMTKEGAINIYAESTMNITAKDGFNLETQKGIKMHGATVDIVADNGLSLSATEINALASGSAKLSAKQALHLKGKNTYLTGDDCIQIKSGGHIDAESACHTINTTAATPASEASDASKPQNMPVHEPRNKSNPASPTASPTANTQNTAASNPSNPYGQTNNFGSGSAQNNYNGQTNNVAPVTYNSGPQGSTQGQASTAGNYNSPTANSNGVDWTTAGAVVGAIGGALIASGSGGYNVNNSSNSQNYSIGELQNNPGNLPYNTNDNFAVGYNNNLAVYAKPENGIAALAKAFDALNISISTRCIDLIQGFLNAKSNSDPKVIDLTRYIQINLSIVADDHVALSDPTTRVGWVSYIIKYLQGRLIYTYDQVVNGCALSVGLDVTTFSQNLQPVTKPWQNNNGNNPFSGFVNPANTNSVMSSGSSPLQTIAGALVGGGIGALIGNALKPQNTQSSSPPSNQSQVIQVSDPTAYRRYLESNPDTPSGTTFQFSDGSTATLGGTGYGLSDYPPIIDTSKIGNGQCAAVPQTLIPNFGTMNSLSQGSAVLGNPNIKIGTFISTFNFTDANGNPNYAPPGSGGISGQSHIAIYLGQGSDDKGPFIIVQDQWASSNGCLPRKIYTGGAEGADKMYVALSNANGKDPNGVQVPGSDNYNPNNAPKFDANNPAPLPPVKSEDTTPDTTQDTGRDMAATNTSAEYRAAAYGDTTPDAATQAAQLGRTPDGGYNTTDAANYAAASPVIPQGSVNPADISDGVIGYGSSGPNYIPQNVPGVTPVTFQNTGESAYLVTDSNGNTIKVTQQQMNQIADQGYSNEDLQAGGGGTIATIVSQNQAQQSATLDSLNQPLVSQGPPAVPPDVNFNPINNNGANQVGVGNIPDSLSVTTNNRDSSITGSPTSNNGDNIQSFVEQENANANYGQPTPQSVAANPADDPTNTELLAARASANASNVITPQSGQTINAATGNNPAITGSQPAPGTGGTSGSQATPNGSSQTGAGGKSC
jgi:hypothetical protein